MTETREATAVFGVPCGPDGGGAFYTKIGHNFPYHDKTAPVVTRITVTADLPGMYCHMERVRVLAEGDRLLWEGPLHNLEGVRYD